MTRFWQVVIGEVAHRRDRERGEQHDEDQLDADDHRALRQRGVDRLRLRPLRDARPAVAVLAVRQPGGYQCNGASPTGLYKYVEADVTYTHDKTQVNAQVDYGERAWNGGTRAGTGCRCSATRSGRCMGATLRFDYLNNTSNGGGGTNIQYEPRAATRR